METEHFDVLIMGAGLSGIDAAWHLQNFCPGRSYVILEQRDAIGGTWDLFRYPGVRSDSDMFTMSYSFRPWRSAQAISPGSEIREYIQAVTRDAGLDATIRFGHQVRHRFAGRVVHPQAWPDDLEYRGKRVVIIGSGATAVTLLPAMAETAAHVTMLLRSPSSRA